MIKTLSDSEVKYWASFEIKLASENYSGETLDFNVGLEGVKSGFSAIYNKDSQIVVFSFVSEIS